MGKHILQLGPVPPPEGGISRNILAIRSELRRRGHRCTIIATSRSTDPVAEDGVFHPKSSAEFAMLLARGKFDLIHAHIGGDLTKKTLAIALAATLRTGKRSVFTLHSGGFPSTPAARSARPYSLPGRIFRRFGAVIALNDELAEVFARYGVGATSIRKILPFSVSDPDQSIEVPERFRNFTDAHAPFILSVGGLEKEYDPLFQITAMERIRAEFPEAGLLLVGDGSMMELAKAAVAKSAHKSHTLLAGNVPHAIVLHLIEEANIVLRMTLFDGDAISVREALHLGTPVIATDTGMRPAGARLIRARNKDDLIAQMQAALADGRGERKAPENDNVRAVADLYESLF